MSHPSRRAFLKRSGFALGSVLLAACQAVPTSVPADPVPSSTPLPNPPVLPAATPSPVAATPTAAAKARGKNPTPVPLPLKPSIATAGILGRPTDTSVTLNLLTDIAMEVTYEYGTTPGVYAARTTPKTATAGVPLVTLISGLQPNTRYTYRMLSNGAPSGEHTFHTQRAPGSPFTFTIDADPHNRDPNFNGELYAATLANALSDQPDFHINLGDTFMTEKIKPSTFAETESTFLDMRPYFGILGSDVPLFLVNGNHEGELGWLARGKDKNLAIWSTQLRQKYFPNPTPNHFYTGSTTPDALLGGLRDGYFAWTWGDALFIVLDPFWYTQQKAQADDLANNWTWTLGREQYNWLKTTLETSKARFKLVFIHHLVGGDKDARGGIEFVPFFEWGGNNVDGSYGFEAHRPGWGKPIHQLLVANHVRAVFHGHDHVFVKQDLDGIVYQEVPQPSNTESNGARLAADYGYTHGVVLGSSGHLRAAVRADQITIEYVRANIKNDQNAQVDYTYTIK